MADKEVCAHPAPVVILSEPPTVDIKSKKANAKNSGNIVLNPPPSQMGAK